jgi:large subunit ribosomal protein L29
MKENADKARALDTAEIAKQLKDTAEQMFRLRFQMSMGQMEGVKKVRSLRKERARMLTVLRERENEPKAETATPVAAKPAAKKPAAKKTAAVKKAVTAAAKKPAAAKAPAAKAAPAKATADKPAKKAKKG